MKERKIYYKVVWPTPVMGSYRSLFTVEPSLVYEVGKYTETVRELADLGFHPTIFKDKASAKKFARAMMYGKVFECHIIGLIKEPPLPFTCGAAPLRFMQEFREGTSMTFSVAHREGAEWPDGTLMAKKVKLLRKV